MSRVSGYIVIDIETTGLSPQDNRAVEIAAILLSEDLQVEEWWTTLLNPEQHIGATHIHGISAADVVDAPVFSNIAPKLLEELHQRTLVAHNVKFDGSFISEELRRCGLPSRLTRRYCTMEQARRLSIKPATLDSCCKRYSIKNPAPHTALGDAASTAQLFMHFNQPGGGLRKGEKVAPLVMDASNFADSQDWSNILVPRCTWL